jgi:hypothetical protein
MRAFRAKTVLVILAIVTTAPIAKAQSDQLSLNQSQASHFARLALKCVRKEFPNKLDHVMNNSDEVRDPKQLHPAFYGCFDWHSTVHGHWMLVHLLKTFPDLAEGPQIREALNDNLSAKNIAAEVAYLNQKSRASFERTYGWAWLLKLAQELHDWNDEDGRKWSRNLQPLAAAFVEKYIAFLPKQNYPIRTGVHPNTAFGLAFALDYARAVRYPKLGNVDIAKARRLHELESLIVERSRTYFAGDVNYPSRWEPGGEDFFSAALMEADLMRRVMNEREFTRWFHRFLPGIARNQPSQLLEPAIVTDRTDPKLVHLDGLNLSRAWCMRNIGNSLPRNDPARAVMRRSAVAHAQAALPHVASGSYEGEHWLASFAVYMLTTPAP